MKNRSTPISAHPERVRSALFRHVDSRIVALTLFNALLYWPWRWLRHDYDAGIRHPTLVLLMMAVTALAWWPLLKAIANQLKGRYPN